MLFYLPYYSMRNFFSPLVHHIETLFLTGKPPYPIERTLLTTGMTAARHRVAPPGPEAARDAPPRGPLPARPGIHLLEELNDPPT